MSNAFVIIKMCYMHNQWYDILCATLYIKIYYKHNVPPTCFGHSCCHLQGHKLQKMDTLKWYEVCEPRHRYKIPSFKNMWFKKYILQFKIQIKLFVISSSVQRMICVDICSMSPSWK